jgi:N-acylneuraminate cytidylyltransferase
LASDTASSESAIIHAIENIEAKGDHPDIIVFLQCTSPLRHREDIDNTISLLIDGNYDSVLSVSPNKHFIWRKEGTQAKSFNYDYRKRPRRQDRAEEYFENGSIYAFRTEGFLKHKNRLFGKIGLYVMPAEYSFEIDDEVDFYICSSLFKYLLY